LTPSKKSRVVSVCVCGEACGVLQPILPRGCLPLAFGHSQVGFGHTRNRLQERVYIQDPTYVRLDIAWKCRRNAGRLRSCEWAAVYGTSDPVPHLSPSSPSPH
jgi:hypothetical protein